MTRAILVATLIAVCAYPAVAQRREARMPVSVVAGRLVVRCEVSTKFERLPANLFIDYDRPCALELHNRFVAGLKAEQGATFHPLTINLPGFDITVPRREHGRAACVEAHKTVNQHFSSIFQNYV